MTGAEWGEALHCARARLNGSECATGAAVALDMQAAMCAINGKCAPDDAHVLERKQGAKVFKPIQAVLLQSPQPHHITSLMPVAMVRLDAVHYYICS